MVNLAEALHLAEPCIVELMVPWEAAVDENYEHKRWTDGHKPSRCTQVLPVEVGRRGFVSMSTTRLPIKNVGVHGQASHKMSVRGRGARQQLAVDEEEGTHVGYVRSKSRGGHTWDARCQC